MKFAIRASRADRNSFAEVVLLFVELVRPSLSIAASSASRTRVHQYSGRGSSGQGFRLSYRRVYRPSYTPYSSRPFRRSSNPHDLSPHIIRAWIPPYKGSFSIPSLGCFPHSTMSDIGKDHASIVEHSASDDEDSKSTKATVPQFTEEQQKAVWAKIDRRLLPILSLLYLFSFLDRGA
jgi:hypothetical protein